MQLRESFWSCVQIIVWVIVNEIQTASGPLVLQEQIQSQWRGLISNTFFELIFLRFVAISLIKTLYKLV